MAQVCRIFLRTTKEISTLSDVTERSRTHISWDILDQVGNPDDCQWSIYEGPLFIDFRLPVEWSVKDDHSGTPVTPQQVVIGNVDRIAAGNIVEAMQLCLADGDDGYETGAEVLRLAFPKLHAAIEESYEGDESLDREEALPEAELRKALHAELERFFAGSWRRADGDGQTPLGARCVLW